jgi:hypothetical protein
MSHKIIMYNALEGVMKAATLNQSSIQPYINGVMKDWKISPKCTTHFMGTETKAGIKCNRTDLKMGQLKVATIWVESK